MQDLILQPNDSIILQPGESIAAGDVPLRIRVGRPEVGKNEFANAEEMRWHLFKEHNGNQTAIYRRGDESRLIHVIPESRKPDSFGFEGQPVAITSRTFKVQKSDLLGWLPEHGDILEWNEKIYTVEMTGASPMLYQDIGSYDVVMRIFVTEYRGDDTD